jgi:hypothetical protein
MAEVNGRIDGWWKILHLDDSTMTREELRSPNPWLSRAAPRSFRDNYALDAAFVLIDGAKLVFRSQSSALSTHHNFRVRRRTALATRIRHHWVN